MRSISSKARPCAALLTLVLAACAGGEIAGEPGVMLAVKDYYESNGREDGGRCISPRIWGTPRGEVLERTADRLVLRVTYTYRDPSMIYRGACGGSGSRVFTVARTPDGPKVTDMSGLRHPAGIHIERVDDSGVW